MTGAVTGTLRTAEPSVLAASEALHERVRRFASAALHRQALQSTVRQSSAPALRGTPPESGDSFESLALAIARYQAQSSVVVARLSAGAAPETLAKVPALPADVFRLARVAVHGETQDVARFCTSGTTGGAGVHPFRTLVTYRELSVAWGRRALLPELAPAGAVTVLALAPPFEPERRSSLGFMLQAFIESFDGRPLRAAGHAGGQSANLHAGPWLSGPAGLDLEAFERGVAVAGERGEPVLLLATSFALVWLLERLRARGAAHSGGRGVALPPGSVVMHTGGFKGKSREVAARELVPALCDALALEPERMVAEYGMTELSSQLYDRGFVDASPEGRSVFVEPPWLRVDVVDPESLAPLPEGQVGLARFTDLGNIDSALVVLTQDRVRRIPRGIELCGRQAGAPLRGCSLATEELLAKARHEAGGRAGSLRHTHAVAREQQAAAHARLERLLAAAQRLADPRDALGASVRAELLGTAGLSAPGIELGLRCSLEAQVSEAELAQLLQSAVPAARVHVILAGNVFVAAHRALALALAASADVRVKPSRREPAFVRALAAAAPGLFRIVEGAEYPWHEVLGGDAVYAYASDQTLAAVKSALPAGAVLHAHGAGFGVAVVDVASGEEPRFAELARALVQDTLLFEQRGCLSPRLVLALGSLDGARAFGAALARAFEQAESLVPRGRLSAEERAEISWYRQCAAALGPLLYGGSAAVTLSGAGAPLRMAPSGRNLHVAVVAELASSLGSLEQDIVSAGCSTHELEASVRGLLPRARVCALGQMQRPPLDGPVDRRCLPPAPFGSGQ